MKKQKKLINKSFRQEVIEALSEQEQLRVRLKVENQSPLWVVFELEEIYELLLFVTDSLIIAEVFTGLANKRVCKYYPCGKFIFRQLYLNQMPEMNFE